MRNDIQPFLDEWPFDPEKLCVRRIKGKDGREKIQLRIEMGILQMEISGRPDGERPHDCDSLLHYYRHQARTESKEEFTLDTEAVMSLQVEAIQYYQRRISFLELGEYKRAMKDAERNLDLFDFVKEYASDDEDKFFLEHYRPFVIGHRIRADVLLSLEDENYEQAQRKIQNGIKEIRAFFKDYDRPDLIDESEEIIFLEEWSKEIRKDQPRSLSQDLNEQLREAVAVEDFERAAELRDRLRALSQS